MEGRNPQTGDDHPDEHEPVGRRHRGESDSDSRKRNPAGQQPDRPAPVRPEPEERLHDRRGGGRGEHDRRGKGVRERELVDEERQQRRQRTVREIGREVAARERRHRTLVELGPHSSAG